MIRAYGGKGSRTFLASDCTPRIGQREALPLLPVVYKSLFASSRKVIRSKLLKTCVDRLFRPSEHNSYSAGEVIRSKLLKTCVDRLFRPSEHNSYSAGEAMAHAADIVPLLLDEEEDELAMLWLDDDIAGNQGPQVIFDLRDISDVVCVQQFRFTKDEIFLLSRLLNIADPVICSNGVRASASFALCVMLRRLSYPNRWCDLTLLFGRTRTQLSMIFHCVCDQIVQRFGHKLSLLDQPWIQPAVFAEAIARKGAAVQNCWGFIDGTAREISRPSQDQQHVFSGHKRKHVIKFQSIMAPNGLVANLSGPYAGRRHDSGMLAESGLLPILQDLMTEHDGTRYCLFGDSGYPLSSQIMTPFRGANLSPEEVAFNKSMSSVRQCVEWGFGKVATLFAFVDFRKNLKLFKQPVGKYYILAHLLTNCHTCLRGSETSEYFDIDPPTLEEYLS